MIRLLAASVAVANRSGNIIREVLKSGRLGVVQKVCIYKNKLTLETSVPAALDSYLDRFLLTVQGYDDPQTEADRRAERCIVATLTTRFPNITVIGEEVRAAV